MMRELRNTWPNPLPVYVVQRRLVVLLPEILERNVRTQLTEAVLAAIRTEDLDGVILDASGVQNADGPLCGAIVRIGKATREAGLSMILCGLTPYMVATLRTMSFPFTGVATTAGLSSGLELAGLIEPQERLFGAPR